MAHIQMIICQVQHTLKHQAKKTLNLTGNVQLPQVVNVTTAQLDLAMVIQEVVGSVKKYLVLTKTQVGILQPAIMTIITPILQAIAMVIATQEDTILIIDGVNLDIH